MSFKQNEIPNQAFRQSVSEVQINETDDGKIRMSIQALGGDVLDHWFFGRIVQDLSGMRMSKDRIPVDYNHNPSEIIGYAELQSTDGTLALDSYIIPFGDDRGAEVAHKMKAGIPYQASIDYTPTKPDEVKFEQIEDGQMTTVNGREFVGPLTVVRQWTLHGVAITPHGADSDTESKLRQSLMSQKKEKQTMSEATQKPTEREAFVQFVNRFGKDKAAEYYMQGLSMEQAADKYAQSVEAENVILKKDIEAFKQKIGELETAIAEKQAQIDASKAAAPKHDSTEGGAEHVYTRAEISKMTPAQYEQNRATILEQVQKGLVK